MTKTALLLTMATMLTTALLTGCSDDDASNDGYSWEQPFTLTVSEVPWDGQTMHITRSGETLDYLKSEGFGLYSEDLGIGNEQVTWSGTKWTLAHTLIWPKTRPNDFYAYAPYAAEPAITNGVYTFTCPNDNTTDLLYGPYVSTTGDVVNLQFHHALAKLSFTTIVNSSAHDMLVSDIRVTGDLYSNGNLTLSTGGWADLPAPSGQTIQIIPDNKFIYVPADGESPVRLTSVSPSYEISPAATASPMLIPGPTVNASYKVYNERTDFEELTSDMFYKWDGRDGSASISSSASCTFPIGQPLEGGDVVYGTVNVMYDEYANISDYDKLIVVGTPGVGMRILMNRLSTGDSSTPSGYTNDRADANGGNMVEKLEVIGVDGYVVIDLASLKTQDGFVHLNTIKLHNLSIDGTATKILLVKTTHHHTVSGTTVLEQGKEKTFHLTVGVNHEVVMED